MPSFLSIILIACGRASWIWPLAPITAILGYALLWKSIRKMRSYHMMWSWLSFSTINLIHLSWMLSHPFWYIVAVWIALSLLLALPYALITQCIISGQISTASSLFYASLLSLVEWSFTLLPPCGFPFQTAALHLSYHPVPLQTASLIGGIGLSFLVFWTNLLFYAQKFHTALCIALIPYCAGSALYIHRAAQKAPYLKAAIINMEEDPDVFSASLSPYELHTREWGKVFAALSHLKADSVDCIILPEVVVPYPAQALLYPVNLLPKPFSPPHVQLLSSLHIAKTLASHFSCPIVLGLENRRHMNISTNSCFFIPPDHAKEERYDKQLLLPLGEYVPELLPKSLLASYGIHDSFSPGETASLFDASTLRLAPLICYEETFSSYVKKAAKLSPNALVSLNNDSWFPSSRLKIEHLEIARIRAVEVGKPLFRSCNKGVSIGIDAMGRDHLPSDSCTSLSLYSPFSFFLKIEESTIVLSLVLLAICAAMKKESVQPLQKPA